MKSVAAALGLLALTAACSPPAATTEPPPAPATVVVNENDALGAVLTPFLAADFGQPVALTVETANVQGDWAFVVAQPAAPAGGAIDWTTTPYAERAREGVLDSGGKTYALLQRQNGVWVVRDYAVGPTDVAYGGWATEYGAPAEIITLDQR
ncbi:MAG: hypothetical protein WDM79_00650 [Terricaulis sp.]